MGAKSASAGKRFELPLPLEGKDSDELFQFLNPYGGEVFEVGSKVTIRWKGGSDAPEVRLLLVDHDDWVVMLAVGGYEKNNGEYTWQIPEDFRHVHTHDYLFYIEDAYPTDGRYTRSTWTYGPLFKIH
jgi:hypothetical protein